MASAGGAGRSLLLLILLLGIAGGAGAWNYQRNLAKEAEIPRPWKGYGDQDLRAMAEAYGAEIEQYSKTWEGARSQRMAATGRGHVDDRAREFDQIYARGRQVRQIKSKLAEHEVVLEQIEQELALREGERDEWQLHMRRLLTFD